MTRLLGGGAGCFPFMRRIQQDRPAFSRPLKKTRFFREASIIKLDDTKKQRRPFKAILRLNTVFFIFEISRKNFFSGLSAFRTVLCGSDG
jgi:hypothetical protein